MQPTRSIPLAEEDAATRAFLADNLTADGYQGRLLRDVWGFRLPARTRTVDSHVCRLRHKLAATADGRFLQCVWGVGYRLISPVEQRESAGRA
jgi:DNA-binding response OmpR family regulator